MKRSNSMFWLVVFVLSFCLVQIAPLSASGQALYDRNKDVRKDRQVQKQKKVETAIAPKPKKDTPKVTEQTPSKDTETKSTEEKNADKQESA